MPGGTPGEQVIVSVIAAVVIAAVGAWLTGQFAALMFMGAWPHVSLTEALQVTFRLPGHLADPQGAWPAAVQGELPGTAAFYVAAMTALGILGFGTSAAARWALRQALRQRSPAPQASPATRPAWAAGGTRVRTLPPGLAGRPPANTTLN